MSAVYVKTTFATNNNSGSAITSVGSVTTTSTSGNVLVAFVTVGGNTASTPSWITPAGWNDVPQAAGTHIRVYYKPNCAANETPTFTWTNGGTAVVDAIVEIDEYSGCGSAPTVNGFASSGTASPMTINITGTNAGDAVLTCATQAAGATPPTFGSGSAGWLGSTNQTIDSGISTMSIRSALDHMIPGSGGTQSNSQTTTVTTNTWYYAGVDIVPGDPSTNIAWAEQFTIHPFRSWAMNRQRMSVVQMAQHNVIEGFFFASIPFDPTTAGWMDQNFARPSNILWSPRRIPGSSDLRSFPFSEDVPGITGPGEWAPSATPIQYSRRITPLRGSETEIPIPIVAAGVDQYHAWHSQQTYRPPYKPRLFQSDLSFSVLLAPDTSGTFLLDQNPFYRHPVTLKLQANDQWQATLQPVTVPDLSSIVAITIQSPSPVPMQRLRIGSQHSEAVSIAAPGIEYVTAFLAQGDRPLPRAFLPRAEAAAFPILVLPAGIAMDWHVDQQVPIRRVPRAIPAAEDQSTWFATLTADVTHAWDVPTSQPLLRPFRAPRAQGDDERITLIVSAAESFAWNIENPSPVRRQYVPRMEQFSTVFFAEGTGGGPGGITVIVRGPFYVVAGEIQFPGAVTGDIVGEG